MAFRVLILEGNPCLQLTSYLDWLQPHNKHTVILVQVNVSRNNRQFSNERAGVTCFVSEINNRPVCRKLHHIL